MASESTFVAQQLAEFLAAVAGNETGDDAARIGVARLAEVFESEVAAAVVDGEVVASVGYPAGAAPHDVLVAAARGEALTVPVPGAGDVVPVCSAVRAPTGLVVVLARSAPPWERDELSLMQGMTRVLALAVRMVSIIESERGLRESSEAQAAENATLLRLVQRREALLERLTRIERAIATRRPLRTVLDEITVAAAEIIGNDVVTLRLRDKGDASTMTIVSSVGARTKEFSVGQAVPTDYGLAGIALREQRTVVVPDWGRFCVGNEEAIAAAMAAPVLEDGEPVGVLFLGTRDATRSFTVEEQEMLSTFADHISMAVNDASARERLSEALDDAVQQALHDSLTALPNRTLLHDRVTHAIQRTQRTGNTVAVVFVDIDDFKVVNDSRGHASGDELLVGVARRIASCLRPGDTAARLGGDEFAVLVEDVDDGQALAVADRIIEVLAEPFELTDGPAFVTASAGVAATDDNQVTAVDLLRRSDVAMYRAKTAGKNQSLLFEPGMDAAIRHRAALDADLRSAMSSGALRLAYQPIFDLASGQLIDVEALLRWQHPTLGDVPPLEFITVAEETGQIVMLGRWVIHEATAQLARWQSEAPEASMLGVSINLSPRQLYGGDVVAEVRSAIQAADLEPHRVTLEITEQVMLHDTMLASDRLGALRSDGIRVALDDFGTGYSSLGYLHRFPVDLLKVDRTFVEHLGREGRPAALVRAILGLAETLGLDAVAEGIETAEQLEALQAMRCPRGQGFLLSRPVEADGVVGLLRRSLVEA